jgi:hypothetical protein
MHDLKRCNSRIITISLPSESAKLERLEWLIELMPDSAHGEHQQQQHVLEKSMIAEELCHSCGTFYRSRHNSNSNNFYFTYESGLRSPTIFHS